MLEGVDFTVYYEPLASIKSLLIIITIASVEGLMIFTLDISNAIQKSILYNT